MPNVRSIFDDNQQAELKQQVYVSSLKSRAFSELIYRNNWSNKDGLAASHICFYGKAYIKGAD